MSPNNTMLQVKYDSTNVVTEKEEEAYSVKTLVAECGGVLGLFIGFNFLMVWDFIFFIIKNFVTKSSIKYF